MGLTTLVIKLWCDITGNRSVYVSHQDENNIIVIKGRESGLYLELFYNDFDIPDGQYDIKDIYE